MKITVYTTTDCQFSKQEKEYLNTNKLVFEEKNLETNKDFLTEMLAVSNNFAGTPVTRVEKDDGSIAVLKGFTKEEFDTTFGFAPASTDQASPAAVSSANDTPISPTDVVPPAVGDVKPPVETVAPVQAETPVKPTTDSTSSPDPLKSVMDSLQSKAKVDEPATPPAETPTPEAPQPVIPPSTDQPVSPTPTDSTNPATPPVDLPKVPEPDFK